MSMSDESFSSFMHLMIGAIGKRSCSSIFRATS